MTTASLFSTARSSSPPSWHEYVSARDANTRERLICQYAPLVKYVVDRLRLSLPPGVDRDDLLGYGTIGLIEAVDRFDPQRGVKFETYAILRIRGSIIDALRKLDILPRGVRERARAIEAAHQTLLQRDGVVPSDEVVAAHLDMPLPSYRRALQDAACRVLSLHAGSERDEIPVEEMLADEASSEPLDAVLEIDLRACLTRALDELPERGRLIVTLYYYEELTMKEISAVLGVTESRVSQLLTRSRFQLRALLNRQGISEFELPL